MKRLLVSFVAAFASLMLLDSNGVSAQIPLEGGSPTGQVQDTAEPVDEPRRDFHGSYWLHFRYATPFDLDENGFRDGLDQYLDHRLRLEARFGLTDDLDIVASGDLAGQLAGDTTDTGKDVVSWPRDEVRYYDRSMVRDLYLEWRSPAGLLRVGQMTSDWGMGLVASGGNDEEDVFHDPVHSDVVDRIVFITRPVQAFSDSLFARHFHLALGGDLVFQDDMADLLGGDRAFEGVLSVFYDGPVEEGGSYRQFTGLYAAYRNQRLDDGDRLWAVALDFYSKHEFPMGEGGSTAKIEFEGVYILGRMDFRDGAGPPRARNGADLAQWGTAFKATFDIAGTGLRPGIEIGAASGDEDTLDDVGRAMKFDPNHQVGMILFQEVLGRMSAHAPDRISDPALLFKAPDGYKLSATSGSITNAVYVYPRIACSPVDGLVLKASFLWARALAPVAAPYNTSANGGYALGYRVDPLKWGGRPWTAKDVGVEVDGGISYRVAVYEPVSIRLGVEGGWARPGAAFQDAAGVGLGNLYKVRALADVLW